MTIRRALRNALNRVILDRDVEYIEADNGQEALETVQTNDDIDLVMLDINMPIMRGDQFLDKLRSEPALNKVKVIVVTTEAEKNSVKNIIKKGVNGYVIKPFQIENIRKSILPILQRM